MNKRPITYRPVSDLTIHPSIVDDPRLAPRDPRYLAMQAAWREAGSLPPLVVTARGEIVDGRHKYWWALEQGIDEVPCVEVGDTEIEQVVLSALAGRNHVTKGQRAYLAVPKLRAAFEAALDRRAKILTSGGKTRLPLIPSVDDLAEQLGIGCRLLDQARRIHSQFVKVPKLKKVWEAKILADEGAVGLGAALAGMAAQLMPKKASWEEIKAARNSHFAQVKHWWVQKAKQWKHWEKLAPDEKDAASELVRAAVDAWPDDLLTTVTTAIRNTRRAKNAGKGEE